jgi:hypothetical protein
VRRLFTFPVAAAALSVAMLVGALAARANPNDRFTASIVPSAVQPPGIGQYTISLANLPNSSDATAGSIAIPTGFVVDGVISPPVAQIVSGPCAGHAWNVTLSTTTIALAAPASASALCARATLAVTFTVLVAPPGDGRYQWTTALSGAGAFAAQAQPVLFVDGTAPETTIAGTPPALTNASASFGFAGDDGSGSGIAGFECKLDEGAFAPCTSPASYNGLADGSHTFSVRARDRAGNIDPEPATVTWTVDAIAPTTSITAGPPDLSASRSGEISFTGSDAHEVHFECSTDGAAFTACSSPASYSGLNDGTHSFAVRAIDAVGNTDASPATRTWEIDATAPPTPVITSAPADPSGDSTPHFEFTDGDPAAGFRCQLDDGPFLDCSSGAFTAPVLADGSHSFGLQAFDPAGNTSAVASYSWRIDTVSPLVTYTEVPPLLTNQISATFGFSANKPGSTFECSLDGAGFTACTSPKVYSGLGNGSHTVAVRAVRLGFVGPPSAYTWFVDLLPPETTIASGPPATTETASATFEFTASEQSTFTCRLDGGGPTPCTSPTTYTGLGDGAHTFSVQAVDLAGNPDPTPATRSWQISHVGPPGRDLRPPANVHGLARTVSYRLLKLTWKRPADSDFDHVALFVSTKRNVAPRTLVYSGTKQSYVNHRFQNGLDYRYLIVSYDASNNASGGTSALVPPSALLRAPQDGGVVRSAPLLRWLPVRGATFYNVQIFYRGQKILSAWPLRARQTLTRNWAYAGRRFTLRKGPYAWFVWPAFGPRAKSHYGQLLGQGTFKVR